MLYKRRGLCQYSASKAKLVKLKLSSGGIKHQTAKLKKNMGKQATLWITKNACSKLAVKIITKFKERPCNTEFRIAVLTDINTKTTINYMF